MFKLLRLSNAPNVSHFQTVHNCWFQNFYSSKISIVRNFVHFATFQISKLSYLHTLNFKTYKTLLHFQMAQTSTMLKSKTAEIKAEGRHNPTRMRSKTAEIETDGRPTSTMLRSTTADIETEDRPTSTMLGSRTAETEAKAGRLPQC